MCVTLSFRGFYVHDTTESPEASVELGKLDREGEYEEDFIYRIG
jgi:hypothetical protein